MAGLYGLACRDDCARRLRLKPQPAGAGSRRRRKDPASWSGAVGFARQARLPASRRAFAADRIPSFRPGRSSGLLFRRCLIGASRGPGGRRLSPRGGGQSLLVKVVRLLVQPGRVAPQSVGNVARSRGRRQPARPLGLLTEMLCVAGCSLGHWPVCGARGDQGSSPAILLVRTARRAAAFRPACIFRAEGAAGILRTWHRPERTKAYTAGE